MKKLLFIILLNFIISLKGFGQETSIKLFVKDSLGQIDSILVGIDENATLGIDSFFSEVNIYGTPYNDLDMRVIQRDSISFNCTKLKSPENIDTKNDIRYYTRFEDFKNRYFEILINSSNYPLTIYGDFSKFGGMFQKWSIIRLLDNSCEDIDIKGLPPLFNDTLFRINDSSISRMLLIFDVHADINDDNIISNSNFNIYPNPFSDIIKIENRNFLVQNNLQVNFYNLLGQIERVEKLNSNISDINLTNLNPGIYFIEIEDNSHKIYRQKIIKY